MELITLGLLLLGSLIATTVQGVTAQNQLEAQKEANEKNIELQKLANEAQIQQVQMTNEFNAAEAQKQRAWEEQMSNTAIQRSMADYSAAGLNPILAVPGGAAVPSGATAQGNVANIGAAKVAPASLDLSGIASAVQSMTNFMLTAKLLDTKQSFADTYKDDSMSRQLRNSAQANYYTARAVSATRARYYRAR